jgi:hypothetical protein
VVSSLLLVAQAAVTMGISVVVAWVSSTAEEA